MTTATEAASPPRCRLRATSPPPAASLRRGTDRSKCFAWRSDDDGTARVPRFGDRSIDLTRAAELEEDGVMSSPPLPSSGDGLVDGDASTHLEELIHGALPSVEAAEEMGIGADVELGGP